MPRTFQKIAAGRRDIDAAKKRAAAEQKPVSLRWGGGLILWVTPAGTASWRTYATVAGRRRPEVLGHWPAMSVDAARSARQAVRDTVRAGGDPSANRHARRATRQSHDAATVSAMVEQWTNEPGFVQRWKPGYRAILRARLANHVLPVWGNRPIASIHQDDVAALVGAIWKPREEGGQGLRQQAVSVSHHLAGLFDYAVSKDKCAANPVRKIKASLPRRKTRGKDAEKPQAHVRKLDEAQAVLRAVEASNAGPMLKLAHRLIALCATRKMEAMEAQWSELSEDRSTWTIPAERMKTGVEHVVYLSPAARDVCLAAEMLAADLGIQSEMVFPGAAKSGACNHSTLTAVLSGALKRIGLEGRHTTHGWRSTFCTIMSERDIRNEILTDLAIGHCAYKGAQSRYNHAQYVQARTQLATEWATLLLEGASSAFALAGYDNVVPLRGAA